MASDFILRLRKWPSIEDESSDFIPVITRTIAYMLRDPDATMALRMCYETGPLACVMKKGLDILADHVESDIRVRMAVYVDPQATGD